MKRLYDARFVRALTTAASVREASVGILRERRRHGESTHPSAWGAVIASGPG